MNHSVLVIGIQTVPCAARYGDLDAPARQLWEEKNSYWLKQGIDHETAYANYAALQAEFGRLIAIGMGFASIRKSVLRELRMHVLVSYEEKELLTDFVDALPSAPNYSLCAHNGREFAYPYLCRRLLVHRMALPNPLQVQDKKPWELQHLEDTFALWQFGDRKHHTSLALLCHTLGVPMVPIEITEEEVCAYYHEKKSLDAIGSRAHAQVVNTLHVYLRLRGLEDAPHPLPMVPYS